MTETFCRLSWFVRWLVIFSNDFWIITFKLTTESGQIGEGRKYNAFKCFFSLRSFPKKQRHPDALRALPYIFLETFNSCNHVDTTCSSGSVGMHSTWFNIKSAQMMAWCIPLKGLKLEPWLTVKTFSKLNVALLVKLYRLVSRRERLEHDSNSRSAQMMHTSEQFEPWLTPVEQRILEKTGFGKKLCKTLHFWRNRTLTIFNFIDYCISGNTFDMVQTQETNTWC